MQEHYHASIEHILVYGVSAILVINLTRIISGWMVNSKVSGLQTVGKAAGSLVHFGS